jgi:predicted DNA-binding transcriptional regulator YafY
MSTNKNALVRYKILDRCFRNPGKYYFIEDLMDECANGLQDLISSTNGISRRQIFEDIKFMESTDGWSIDLDRIKIGKRVAYRYMNLKFSINNMPLNELELNQLSEAVEILSQFRGMPQFEWIHELLPKLKNGYNSEAPLASIMEFDHNEYLVGVDNLGILHNAILYKKVLKIGYQPFENERPNDIIIHPFYLKQYNNRWFLFGYNPEIEKFDWNLAIDRIISVTEMQSKYKENSVHDWKEYFDDIIGVTKPDKSEIEDITLHFYGKTGKYMESKPIHGSQKSKWIKSDILEVKLNLIINYEFERLILSYADSVSVVKPMKLKKIIMNRFQNAIELYQKRD